ncbi:hypothetical protein TNCV_161801 [Trichonephila clavipes]|nr:hypothetical protein TNCV_161801 [Trichonephila clavipes]
MIPPSKSKPRIFLPKESYKGPITRSRIKTLEQNDSGRCLLFRGEQCHTHNLLQVPIAELAERWTELPQVSDESDHSLECILVISRIFEVYKSRVHRQLGMFSVQCCIELKR